MMNKEWDELNNQIVPFWMSIDTRTGHTSSLILYYKKELISDDVFQLYKSVELFYDGVRWNCVVYANHIHHASKSKMFKGEEFTSDAKYMKTIDSGIMHNIIKMVFMKGYEKEKGRFNGAFE